MQNFSVNLFKNAIKELIQTNLEKLKSFSYVFSLLPKEISIFMKIDHYSSKI
jgi:hypothetical protein